MDLITALALHHLALVLAVTLHPFQVALQLLRLPLGAVQQLVHKRLRLGMLPPLLHSAVAASTTMLLHPSAVAVETTTLLRLSVVEAETILPRSLLPLPLRRLLVVEDKVSVLQLLVLVGREGVDKVDRAQVKVLVSSLQRGSADMEATANSVMISVVEVAAAAEDTVSPTHLEARGARLGPCSFFTWRAERWLELQ